MIPIETGFNILHSFLHRKYINHIHFFTSFLYSPSLVNALPLALSMTCFSFYSSFFRCLFIVQWNFCLGIIPVYVLCLSQYNPTSIALSHLLLPLFCVVTQSLLCFIVSWSYKYVMYFIIIC
jgi:hypothetical protein